MNVLVLEGLELNGGGRSVLKVVVLNVIVGLERNLTIFYTHHLLKIEDWSAFMDTTAAMAFVAAVFLIVTIPLNRIQLFYIVTEQQSRMSNSSSFV